MTMVVRLAFIFLILIGISARLSEAIRTKPAQDNIAALSAAVQHLGVNSVRIDDSNWVSGQITSCAQPVSFTLMALDATFNDVLNLLPNKSDDTFIVYNRQVFNKPRRITLFGQWLLARGEVIVGLRQILPATHFVVVAVPAACATTLNVDWGSLSS